MRLSGIVTTILLSSAVRAYPSSTQGSNRATRQTEGRHVFDVIERATTAGGATAPKPATPLQGSTQAVTGKSPPPDIITAFEVDAALTKALGAATNLAVRVLSAKNRITQYLAGSKKQAVARAKMQHSAYANTATQSVGTMALVTCTGLVYLSGQMAVVGHFTGEIPGEAIPAGPAGSYDDEERISYNDQLAEFNQNMVKAGLTGAEPNGQWFLFPPAPSMNNEATQALRTLAQGHRNHFTEHTIPEWTTAEKANTLATTKAGKGIVIVNHGKVYYGNEKIFG